MRAGDLRRQITIEAHSDQVDSYGQRLQAWAPVCITWAAIEPLAGRELETAQAVYAEATIRVVMRYRTGIDTSMRVVYQGRLFNILEVRDTEMAHKALELLLSEGTTNG